MYRDGYTYSVKYITKHKDDGLDGCCTALASH